VLIAVELLLFEWKPRSLIPVAVAAATAAALRPLLVDARPLFPLAPHRPLEATALLGCVAVGLAAGAAASALTGLVYAFEDLFARLPIH
jgi:CIC family chloride channel protein